MKKSHYLNIPFLFLFFFQPSVHSIAQPGSLDLSFNGTGMVTTDFGPMEAYGRAVAIQNDGKIVVAGYYDYSGNNYNTYITLARYVPTGSLDVTFGSGGTVITALDSSASAYAMAIQSDGKIIVGGSGSDYNNVYFLLVRYKSDGTLDSSFGADGVVRTLIGSIGSGAHALAIQSDGKIVMAGSARSGSYDKFALARYNTDGSLDTSFSNDGKVITPIGSYMDVAYSVVIQSDGRIVAGGVKNNDPTYSQFDFALVRYNSDGTLDGTFGSGGKVITDWGGSDQLQSVAFQSDGKIIATGTAGSGFAVCRYNSDGSLDNTFGSGGMASTSVSSWGSQGCFAGTIQNDDKIILAGYSWQGGNNASFAIVRYNANGSIDNGFGNAGLVLTAIGNKGNAANAVTIQNDGKIVAAGYSQVSSVDYDFGVVRYNGGTVGINEIESSPTKLSVYPDPVSSINSSHITFTYPFTASQRQIIINDVNGRQVGRYDMLPYSNEMQVKLPELAKGVYVARIVGGESVKFVVE